MHKSQKCVSFKYFHECLDEKKYKLNQVIGNISNKDKKVARNKKLRLDSHLSDAKISEVCDFTYYSNCLDEKKGLN